MTENEIATQIVDVAYRVHTTLGPGLEAGPANQLWYGVNQGRNLEGRQSAV